VTDISAGPGTGDPKDDPRTVNDLITAALCEPDEDLAWDAICALQWRGTHEVLDRAARLCRSLCVVERRLGANMLGQLGLPERTFPEECLDTLLGMLENERDHGVLYSVLVALSHLHRPEAIGPACRFRGHVDPDVRYGVVFALMGHEDLQALEALIELTRDPEARVRDWATFALGSQVEADTPELRDVLAERLDDEDDDTRAEAFVGLARRGDRRVLPVLRHELASDSVQAPAVEAAALMGDPLLHPLLVALQGRWDVDQEALGEAIRACSPRSEANT